MMLKSIKVFWAKTKSKVLLETWSREKTKDMTVKSVRSSEVTAGISRVLFNHTKTGKGLKRTHTRRPLRSLSQQDSHEVHKVFKKISSAGNCQLAVKRTDTKCRDHWIPKIWKPTSKIRKLPSWNNLAEPRLQGMESYFQALRSNQKIFKKFSGQISELLCTSDFTQLAMSGGAGNIFFIFQTSENGEELYLRNYTL